MGIKVTLWELAKKVFGPKFKYIIATLAAAIWICFFDNNNILITDRAYRLQIEDLEGKYKYYQKENSDYKKKIEELQSSDNEMLTKYAREVYFMRKPNEDIYIVK
ncbi:MAG: septum formation initiator family protein [Paludibacteraceae bacterium]|nr:septum formation initiator family protein [Paludibacteraceae bacterium]